eukprot:6335487-Karenia_brevis.AAC.1
MIITTMIVSPSLFFRAKRLADEALGGIPKPSSGGTPRRSHCHCHLDSSPAGQDKANRLHTNG